MVLTLIVVALVSLTFALAMLVVVWRLLREERRRSAARVAVLETGLGRETDRPVDDERLRAVRIPPADTLRVDMRPSISETSLVDANEASPHQDVRPSSHGHVTLGLTTVPGNSDGSPDEAPSLSDHDLFAASARPASAARRFGMVAAIGVLVIGSAATAIVSWNARSDGALDQSASNGVSAALTSSLAPLELVSLTHRRDADGLSITGLIRNPSAGATLRNLTAVVVLFGRDGSFLASARAPIDFSTLPPGDESPFVVTLRQPGPVGRYRVSFRTEERIVPHVDRRDQTRLARSEH